VKSEEKNGGGGSDFGANIFKGCNLGRVHIEEIRYSGITASCPALCSVLCVVDR